MTDTTTDTTATEERFNSREAIRKGFLAYLGLYGTAYDSARKFVNGKGANLFNDIVKKGEEMEARAQESYEDLRKRAEQKYSAQFSSIEQFFSRATNGNSTEVEDAAISYKSPVRKKVASKSASSEAITEAA